MTLPQRAAAVIGLWILGTLGLGFLWWGYITVRDWLWKVIDTYHDRRGRELLGPPINLDDWRQRGAL